MADLLELAYIAGLVDGEGCICTDFRGGRYVIPIVSLTVNMTNPVIINWLRETLGRGSITVRHKANPKHKTQYAWRVCSRQCGQVLTLLLPYLRLKRRQAECALALRALMESRKRYGWSSKNIAVSESERAEARNIAGEINHLNRRGPLLRNHNRPTGGSGEIRYS